MPQGKSFLTDFLQHQVPAFQNGLDKSNRFIVFLLYFKPLSLFH